MKKIISTIIIFTFLGIAPQVFAEDVTSGNASAETTVQNTNNNGDVESHVVTIVNGVRTETNSSSSGSINVVVTNTADSRSQENTGSFPTASTASTTVASSKLLQKAKLKQSYWEKIISSIRNFFSSFFR